MLGKLLADSGGANRIVDGIISRVGPRGLPWAMALVAAIIGLPMFFEIGVVLLVPIVVLVSLRTEVPLMKVGIPALAGLSILHGLVPPHPGPETAITLLHAPLSYTLIFGLIVAVPTLIIAGPLLAQLIHRLVPIQAGNAAALAGQTGRRVGGRRRPTTVDAGSMPRRPKDRPDAPAATRRPAFLAAVACMVLPVLLMLVKAIGDLVINDVNSSSQKIVDFIGTPSVALLVAILFAMLALGRGSGMRRGAINDRSATACRRSRRSC